MVVTGIGVVSPVGLGKQEFFSSLLAGRSGVRTIQRFDTTDYAVHIAAEVDAFDPTEFIDKKAARRMDRYAQYAVAAASMALEDSAYPIAEDPYAVGAFVGSGIGGLDTFYEQTKILLERGPDRVSPFFIPMMIPNMGAANVSITLGLQGPVSSTSTACAAGTNALGDAFEIIRRGDATAMFAGGAEAPIGPIGVGSFAALRALSTRNDEPQRASRPFDAERDGFVIGEGAAVLVLEELAARARARSPPLRGARRLRHDRRRQPSDRTRPDGRPRGPGHHPRPGDGRRAPGSAGLHQRARHVDPVGRRHGDQGRPPGPRRSPPTGCW